MNSGALSEKSKERKRATLLQKMFTLMFTSLRHKTSKRFALFASCLNAGIRLLMSRRRGNCVSTMGELEIEREPGRFENLELLGEREMEF